MYVREGIFRATAHDCLSYIISSVNVGEQSGFAVNNTTERRYNGVTSTVVTGK